MLNSVILIGRLTKDPELRYSPSGVAVSTFTLAVDRRRKQDEGQQADFIPIVVFNKQAENCANYMTKGRLVAVEGRIQVRSYEDTSGQRKWRTEVIANTVTFLDRTKKEDTDFMEVETPDDMPF